MPSNKKPQFLNPCPRDTCQHLPSFYMYHQIIIIEKNRAYFLTSFYSFYQGSSNTFTWWQCLSKLYTICILFLQQIFLFFVPKEKRLMQAFQKYDVTFIIGGFSHEDEFLLASVFALIVCINWQLSERAFICTLITIYFVSLSCIYITRFLHILCHLQAKVSYQNKYWKWCILIPLKREIRKHSNLYCLYAKHYYLYISTHFLDFDRTMVYSKYVL